MIERIIIETDLRPCLIHIGTSNETLSIKVHVSGMKRARDKGMKHISGMKHVRECETYMYKMCNTSYDTMMS